jgi:hypothetical protein
MIKSAFAAIGLTTCLILIGKFTSWLIGRRIDKYLMDRGWYGFQRTTEYNHNQLKYRVDKLEGK